MREGWTYKELGNLCTIKGRIGFRGYTREDLVNEGQGAITLSPSNIIEDKLDLSKCSFISWFKYEESPEIMVFNGDIIYAKTASIGKVAIIDNLPEKATINPQFVVLKEIKCDNKYLYYALRSSFFKEQASSIVRGVAIPTISQANLSLLKIPVPSLQEQKRIVVELDLLAGIIDKQKQQLKELDNLAQSIFYDMFGNPQTDERGWNMEKLSSVCVSISDGSHNPPKGGEKSDYLMLSSKNIKDGVLSLEEPRYLSKDEFSLENKRTNVKKGDILLTIVGTIGRCCLFDSSKNIVFQRSVAILKPNDTTNNLFLMYQMIMLRMVFENEAKGVAQKGIYLRQLGNIMVIVPPKRLQDSFAKKIQAIESQKESINRSIAESQKLFDYTMDKYFG